MHLLLQAQHLRWCSTLFIFSAYFLMILGSSGTDMSIIEHDFSSLLCTIMSGLFLIERCKKFNDVTKFEKVRATNILRYEKSKETFLGMHHL